MSTTPTGWDSFDPRRLEGDLADFYCDMIGFSTSAADTLRSFHRSGRHPHISSHFLEDRKLNARAMLSDSRFHIGLHVAVPCILHFCFNNLLRTSVYHPALGRADREIRYRDFSKGIPLELPEEADLAIALMGIVGLSRPADDQRAAAATALARIATSFCLYHEIAHVELGHVQANHVLFSDDEHLELFEWSVWPWTRRRLARVWEYEADKLASIMVATDMLSSVNLGSLCATFEIGESPNSLLAVALSAVYCIFLLFDQRAREGRLRSSHPPPSVRFCAALEVFCNDVPKQFGHDAYELRTLAFDALMATHRAWQDLGLPVHAKISDVNFFRRNFEEVDRLERDRRALYRCHFEHAWFYPFRK